MVEGGNNGRDEMHTMKLILASASPRRAEILKNAGFDFEVIPAHVDESRAPREDASSYVQRLAEAKARAVANQLSSNRTQAGCVIVAGDTIVVIDGDILGKPNSSEEARAMLRRLSGRWHEVFTGLAVLPANREEARVAMEKTRVEFARISDNEVEEYIRTGEPFDKAGAYAIQGRAGKFILRVEGCYFNVMGLPLARLYAILREHKLL